ncbi:TlpA family protein disulfide reductase [Algibacter luteus]|uniref:Thiol-disulfide isomerase or thioredoxin n=1 Tax=Algibacter luteus TaxID=1178825 RepID=A0A1M6FS20_9FLAO|nr:TlpA disulfide reductase family protein [Algibacter luteus]SHJ00484.1 Thiol-disulfide isomerase or thioredoxin [Algibacter luteus]
MKLTKGKIKNIIFFIIIGLLIIPQTRQPIQVLLHKSLAVFSPSTINTSKQETLEDYNWLLKNSEGTVLNFQDLKGKVILVNFWATWCPPCIAEMPSMEALYKDYSGKIDFVFVSNEDFQVVNEFIKKKGYTFEVFNPLTQYPSNFDVTSIPRTFLLDKEGHIVIDKTGAANWNSDKVRTSIDDLLKL